MATVSTTELEQLSCWCGAPMALPRLVVKNAQETGQSLFCPATGHQFGWTGENDKLRAQLKTERVRVGAIQDQLRCAEREAAKLKGQLSKATKRAAAGVCPCCNRSFVQLTRHMSTKHPDYVRDQK